jgi:hypothetical protein
MCLELEPDRGWAFRGRRENFGTTALATAGLVSDRTAGR